MMKKIFLALVVTGTSAAAFAEAPGGPDCGWGNMIFDGQSGLPAHIFASSTNGTTGNASFGMTSGTNGCSHNGVLTYRGNKWMGISANLMGEFSEDVARGDGDALNAVAVNIGIAKEDRATFAKVMHDNFAKIFTSADVTSEQVVANINTVMKADSRLRKYAV